MFGDESWIWAIIYDVFVFQILFFQFHAMDTLHKNGYDMTRAIAALVPQGGPVLCRDEMEEWSASEANLFEEALEKYGKDFTDIQQDFVSLCLRKQEGDQTEFLQFVLQHSVALKRFEQHMLR